MLTLVTSVTIARRGLQLESMTLQDKAAHKLKHGCWPWLVRPCKKVSNSWLFCTVVGDESKVSGSIELSFVLIWVQDLLCENRSPINNINILVLIENKN